MTSNGLQALISRQQSGRSLEREFYLDPAIWALDVEHVLSSKWHQGGSCRPGSGTGDYFVVELLGESIIIVRGADDKIPGSIQCVPTSRCAVVPGRHRQQRAVYLPVPRLDLPLGWRSCGGAYDGG